MKLKEEIDFIHESKIEPYKIVYLSLKDPYHGQFVSYSHQSHTVDQVAVLDHFRLS